MTIRRLGYACVALGVAATTNRTCRLENATPARLRELIQANLRGLATVLQYNARQDIRLFRITSQLIPFASHPVNTIRWWVDYATPLADLGAYAREQRMRLSMHPGQYTALSSPRSTVVEAAVRDLEYHTRVLDAMGLGPEHKVIIHAGGVYGDKTAAIARFASVYQRLPAPVRARLVLENDERSYAAQDVLLLSQRVGIPVVFDALHDHVLPSPEYPNRPVLLRACFATWRPIDGRPIVHLSSQAPRKQPGAHADWIDPAEFFAYAADTGPIAVDCMLEAKQKDLALLQLRHAIAARAA